MLVIYSYLVSAFSFQGPALKSIAGGVLALKELGLLTTDEKTSALSALLSLSTADGTFRSRPADSTSSVANVHIVLEALYALGGETGSELATDAFEKAFQLIPGSESDKNTVSDVLLMVPLSKLTDKKLRLVGPRLVTVAEELLALKYADDIATQSKVYDGLKLVAAYKASPLYYALEKNTFDGRDVADHKLKVAVSSIVGEDVAVEAVEVASIKAIGKEGNLFQGEKFVDGVLDMSSANLAAGRYLVQLGVTVAGRPKPSPFQSFFVVTDQVVVNAVRFAVSDGGEEIAHADLQPVRKQNSLDLSTANVLNGDKLQLAFEVASETSPASTKKPHQATVRLSHRESGHSVSVNARKAAAAGANGALAYTLTIALAEQAALFQHLSGEYTITIQVGDVSYAAPVEFVVGAVDLRFPAKQNVNLPLYAKSLLHTSDTTLKPLPEIKHVMRPPAKRASNFMATIFTTLILAPLVALVGFIISLKPDFARFGSLFSLLALGSFALTLALYVGYWLSLKGVSFYETIKYLCFLAPVTMFLGSYCLSSVQALRMKEAAAAAGKPKSE